jgi:transposase
MTLEDSVHTFRLRLFQRAEALGNVSQACRELGVSRSLYYQLRKRFVRYGPDGLHPKRRRGHRGRPSAIDAATERQVLALSLAWPSFGPQQLAAQLARQGVHVARSTIHRLLRRRGLSRRQQRFAALEGHSAKRAGLLTERTRRRLAQVRPVPTERQVEASRVGELVCLDCFYVGNLKGVGKVWQITACDAASSYGLAELFVGDPNAAVAARFLRDHVVPALRRAGFAVQRVLTDGGSEFKGAFALACRNLRIRHTRTKPRHAFTNGFVERLQQTILHDHWRFEFRRRYFTRLGQLERSLQSYLHFYNFERAHHGYRTQGRSPAELVWGARDDQS